MDAIAKEGAYPKSSARVPIKVRWMNKWRVFNMVMVMSIGNEAEDGESQSSGTSPSIDLMDPPEICSIVYHNADKLLVNFPGLTRYLTGHPVLRWARCGLPATFLYCFVSAPSPCEIPNAVTCLCREYRPPFQPNPDISYGPPKSLSAAILEFPRDCPPVPLLAFKQGASTEMNMLKQRNVCASSLGMLVSDSGGSWWKSASRTKMYFRAASRQVVLLVWSRAHGSEHEVRQR
jgi:hypothetical protein